MCGIAGFFEKASAPPSTIAPARRRLKRMLDCLVHRGPDDWGMVSYGFPPDSEASRTPNLAYFSEGRARLSLGHRRLSIIDLSDNARQPMRSPDESCSITFNGEIYNYIEIRSELENAGCTFRTSSDTEVLLQAYLHWGKEMLPRLDGMFAFAIWDARRETLLCVRDPLSIKPFYFGENADRFVFGSEPKAVLAGLDTSGHVNPTHLAEFLVLGLSDYDEGTHFQEVRQLRGGFWMEVDAEGRPSTPVSYWQPPGQPGQCGPEAPQLIRAAIDQAVMRQLRSDVPVGGCLSGGLDSAIVVATAARQMGARSSEFKALTLSSPHFERDESADAQAIARQAGVQWIGVEPDLATIPTDMMQMARAMGEPFSGWSMFGSYKVMERARQLGLKVMLNGQGGDEAFLGYPRMARRVLRDYRQAARWDLVLKEWLAMRRNMREPFLQWLVGNTFFSSPRLALWRNHRRARGLLAPGLLEQVRPELAHEFFSGYATQRAQLLDLTRFILPRLLRFEDRNSMAFSLELRVPLLSQPLVEAALRLPLSWRVRDGWSKYVLRVAMEDRIPAHVAWHRNKRGFEVPEAQWTRAARGQIREVLAALPKDAPVNAATLIRELDANRTALPWFWRCISVGLWIGLCDVRC